MAAKPHHPVFMDVLGRILREIERARKQQQGDGTSRHTDKDKTKANQEMIQNVVRSRSPCLRFADRELTIPLCVRSIEMVITFFRRVA